MPIEALAPAAWQLLQGFCASLVARSDVRWAGIAETTSRPRWVAFAGRDIDVPQPPAQGQGYRELDDVPAGTRVAFLTPPMPRRAYACGFVDGVALTVFVVPRAGRTDAAEAIARELGSLLAPLRDIAVPTEPGLRLRHPHHFSNAHDGDWLPIPTASGAN
jgi:hypothetical protein